jgi:hypothetical protein
MRRAALFLLLYPFIAFVLAMTLIGPLLVWGPDYSVSVDHVVDYVLWSFRWLPHATILALPAAILTGVLDWGLVGVRHRRFFCALLGAGVMVYVVSRFGSFARWGFLLYVPVGAIPGAICSWLSGDRQTGDEQARGA